MGRTNQITATLGGQSQVVADQIQYRADGQLASLRYGNGVQETRQYDGHGRLARQTLADAAGLTLKATDYQYDADGNVTQRQVSGLAQPVPLTANYQYDALGRLTLESYDATPERNATYTFDANGNRLTLNQGQGANAVTAVYGYTALSNRLVDVDAVREDNLAPSDARDLEFDI